MVKKNFEFDQNNKEQQMAFDLVKKTDKSLFITGKAGTGKTTFIKLIQKEIDKKFHFWKHAYHAYHLVLSICNKISKSCKSTFQGIYPKCCKRALMAYWTELGDLSACFFT